MFLLHQNIDYIRIAVSGTGPNPFTVRTNGTIYSRAIASIESTELQRKVQAHIKNSFPDAFPTHPLLVIVNTAIGFKARTSTSAVSAICCM